jgi:hypothetical protein
MKTNKLLNVILSGALMLYIFSACTSDFEEINTNDKVLAELDQATIGNVYAYTQYNGLMNGWAFQTSQNLFADLYCQYYSNVQTKFPSDRHTLVGGWLDGAWRDFYGSSAANLDIVLKETDPSVAPELAGPHALALIWKVYIYHRITDYWGPIPYSAVGNGESSVPYDSQEDIYTDFFIQLDDAISYLKANSGGNTYGAHDQIFGGDNSKWLKFANTLKLRLAMRISKIEPAKAKTAAEEAVADGVMLTNADNAIFKTTANSWNALNIMLPWNEFRMSASMESVLKGYNDPRMGDFFSPTRNSVEAGSPEWKGLLNGYTIAGLSAADLHYNELSMMGPRWDNVAAQAYNPVEVILASEAYFLRAEGALKGWNMLGTAKEFYNLGMEMSLAFWGATPDEIATYKINTDVPVATHDADLPMTDIPVLFGDTPDVQLEQIITQKWLALYPDGWEAWADARRTDLPKLYDRLASDNTDVPPNAMMRRIDFVDNEYNTNADAVEAAKGMLSGPDNGATRLWWDPAP